DEPTNHLDIHSKDILKQALMDYTGTLLVISHDRDFLSGLTDKVYECKTAAVQEYLGDINYYLQKKSMTDMRELDSKSAKNQNQSVGSNTSSTQDPEEYRKNKKLLQQIERTIEKLEGEIKTIEAKMAEPDFYQQPDSQSIMEKYQG